VLNLAEWSAVLHLSTMWAFDKVRDLAIDQIDGLTQPAMDRLDLAMKCQVSKWLEPAYVELCTREELLTLEDAERLGIRRFCALSQIREKRGRAIKSGSYCGRCGGSNIYCYSGCGEVNDTIPSSMESNQFRPSTNFNVTDAIRGYPELDVIYS